MVGGDSLFHRAIRPAAPLPAATPPPRSTVTIHEPPSPALFSGTGSLPLSYRATFMGWPRQGARRWRSMTVALALTSLLVLSQLRSWPVWAGELGHRAGRGLGSRSSLRAFSSTPAIQAGFEVTCEGSALCEWVGMRLGRTEARQGPGGGAEWQLWVTPQRAHTGTVPSMHPLCTFVSARPPGVMACIY